jgi:hypothetical protein
MKQKKPKNEAAVALGRKRALSMTPKQRKALAKLAGDTRWRKQRAAEAND